jgi:hypothetical protein
MKRKFLENVARYVCVAVASICLSAQALAQDDDDESGSEAGAGASAAAVGSLTTSPTTAGVYAAGQLAGAAGGDEDEPPVSQGSNFQITGNLPAISVEPPVAQRDVNGGSITAGVLRVDPGANLGGGSGVSPEYVDAYAAGDGPLGVLNCTGSAFRVRTYNSTDTVRLIPFEDFTVPHGGWANLRCATSACTLRFNDNQPFSGRRGPQVYVNGDLSATNETAVRRGCGIY